MNRDVYLKQNILVLLCVVFWTVILGSLFLWQMSKAATTDTVAATVTASNLAVSVTDGSIAFGTVALNTSTTTAGNTDTQVVTNDGSDAKLNVKASNATGGTQWVVGSAAGSDIYKIEVSTTSGSSYVGIDTVDTYVTASSSMTTLLSDNLDFQLTTPTASTDFVQKSVTITVQVVSL